MHKHFLWIKVNFRKIKVSNSPAYNFIFESKNVFSIWLQIRRWVFFVQEKIPNRQLAKIYGIANSNQKLKKSLENNIFSLMFEQKVLFNKLFSSFKIVGAIKDKVAGHFSLF